MTGAQVLTVMRDHTRIGTPGHGGVCLCGLPYWTAAEHTHHVADAIAASLGGEQPEDPPRVMLPAGELTEQHLGRPVVATAGGQTIRGLLTTANDEPHPVPGVPPLVVLGVLTDHGLAHFAVPRTSWLELTEC